ncbi:hypothetical protein H0H87_009458 [Tephrocybe sp. NHM501043]|nr:hypothetical protein H0H87_009458 [Tephrocybe sp. NHM501043]
MSNLADNSLVSAVEEAYSQKARSAAKSNYRLVGYEIAQSVGYRENDLKSIPSKSQLGVGCGSPVDAANLKDGEIVVDLGSGGGIDVLLAAQKVGPRGRAIGIDISPDMIALARQNATEKGFKPSQAAFVVASLIEPLPIRSNTVDCVLSNCVINLLPQGGKEGALKEVYRILKPGGRVILDDIVAKRQLPEEIRNDLTAYVNCISGSILIEEYKAVLQSAGFENVAFLETGNDLQAICSGVSGSCCSAKASSKPKYDVNALVGSYQITAIKALDASLVECDPASVLLRWWDAYPKVKSTPGSISREELASHMLGESKLGQIAVIDVRRDDRVGGHVRGSENWHAQTFYDELPLFLESHQNMDRVIFYCGSSSGRGPRCAGWYQDFVNEKGITSSTAYVLQDGVKAWLAEYKDEAGLVEF